MSRSVTRDVAQCPARLLQNVRTRFVRGKRLRESAVTPRFDLSDVVVRNRVDEPRPKFLPPVDVLVENSSVGACTLIGSQAGCPLGVVLGVRINVSVKEFSFAEVDWVSPLRCNRPYFTAQDTGCVTRHQVFDEIQVKE